jgi:hypothetical protein
MSEQDVRNVMKDGLSETCSWSRNAVDLRSPLVRNLTIVSNGPEMTSRNAHHFRSVPMSSHTAFQVDESGVGGGEATLGRMVHGEALGGSSLPTGFRRRPCLCQIQ